MAGPHIALIVEDEPEMAAELTELVRSFGHGSVHAENKTDALAHIAGGGLCYVLLDMQIKTDRGSIKSYVSAGVALLEEIQQTGDIFFPASWLQATLGSYQTPTAARTVREFLATHPNYNPKLRAKLLQAADDVFRAEKLMM